MPEPGVLQVFIAGGRAEAAVLALAEWQDWLASTGRSGMRLAAIGDWQTHPERP